MAYLSTTGVEAAIAAAGGPSYAAFTDLLTLPNLTWEGRSSKALRIAGGTRPDRIGVYVVGGLHAREWGSSDIVVRLAQDLVSAYAGNHGITYGGRSFSTADVRSVVERLNLYLFPQVNPDGRHYSMTVDPMWRKNRRPGSPPGVDINRNFDFLWNFPKHYSPASPISSSVHNFHDTYIGPAVESEPETRNVVSVVDTNPEIRFVVDLHSYAQVVLYGWGDDEPQSLDPGQNFRNASWDGHRGLADDVYAEYMPASMRSLQESLGFRVRDAIVAAGGPSYVVQPSFNLYPTSGTCTSHVFTRRFKDKTKGIVHPFTIEWGTQFQPPWATMALVVEQVCAGLLDLCLGVIATESDVYIKQSAADTGATPFAGSFDAAADLVVRQQDDNVWAHQDLRWGFHHYVYARVTNRGPNPTRALVVTARAAANTGPDFLYPHDWTASDDQHLVLQPLADTFDAVPSGGTAVAKFLLTAPQSILMRQWQARGWRPGVLAEVECVTDYGTPVGRHVWQDNNLAQRNVTVLPPPAPLPL